MSPHIRYQEDLTGKRFRRNYPGSKNPIVKVIEDPGPASGARVRVRGEETGRTSFISRHRLGRSATEGLTMIGDDE